MDTELKKTDTLDRKKLSYEPTKPQTHLIVPEQTVCFLDEESPIDRYRPPLRRDVSSDTGLWRRSSCYSRNTDGYSLHEFDDTKREESTTEEDIRRPAPAHLCVPSDLCTTRRGNESRLIFQGLSDPYKSGFSSVSGLLEVNDGGVNAGSRILQPQYPLPLTKTPSPLPPPQTQYQIVGDSIIDLPRPDPRRVRPSVPPIRPQRWSAVSPSFRTPTSLVSPWKKPPSIVISSTSRLGQSLIDSKSRTGTPERQQYPPKNDVVLIVLAVMAATLCTALDTIMIPTAIPTITSQFNTIQDVGWYTTSYLLAACSSNLIYTKLYRFHTTKWVFISALLIFTLGSLLSGVAEVSAALIFGRALVGLGASGALPGGLLLMGHCIRPHQLPAYFAMILSVVLVLGPVLGGVLTQYASWRWCFLINLPLALSSCILLLVSSWNAPANPLTQSTFKESLPFLDLEGMSLFLPGILCILLAIQWGGIKYPWSSAGIIVLFAIFVVMIAGFILVQKYKSESASIPPRIFRNRNVYGGMLFSFCLGASIAVAVYYLPLWFQVTKNASASQSGAMLLPLVLSMATMFFTSCCLVNMIGYYTPCLISASVMMSIGSGLLTTLQATSTTSAWIGYQILFGIGAGSGLHQTHFAIQSLFRKSRDIATVTAMMGFAQILGAAVAVGMAQSVFGNKLVNRIQAAGLKDVSVRFVLHTGATEIRTVLPRESLETVLMLYTRAIDQAFHVAVALAAASAIGALIMEWKPVRRRRVQ